MMLATEKECELEVSEFYLRLATESVRLFSNKKRSMCVLGEVVDCRADAVSTLPQYYTAENLRQHLDVIPTEGDITLKFTILESSASTIEGATAMLEEAMGTSVAFADAVSLILYDFIVEENKTDILAKLGLTPEAAKKYAKSLVRTKTNVIPIR
jgi:hypothetical protein